MLLPRTRTCLRASVEPRSFCNYRFCTGGAASARSATNHVVTGVARRSAALRYLTARYRTVLTTPVNKPQTRSHDSQPNRTNHSNSQPNRYHCSCKRTDRCCTALRCGMTLLNTGKRPPAPGTRYEQPFDFRPVVIVGNTSLLPTPATPLIRALNPHILVLSLSSSIRPHDILRV
jgi:hypothetical protein